MICALVLAAGRSHRMGVQKLLLPLGGRPLIARVVDEVLASPVDQVFVVVGQKKERIAEALRAGQHPHERRLSFVTNADVEGEMLTSVRCGLAAMPHPCTAALLVLGDQPAITADINAALIRASQTAGRGIVVPTFGGRRGHPLLLSMKYRNEVLQRYDSVGLRGLLLAHPEDIYELELPDPGILEDLDTPDDYWRATFKTSTQSRS